MNQSEKRHFKLSVSDASANYVQLFDAIDRQDQYNEEAIREQFAGQRFLKQLTFTKNYLYNAILRSLANYHRELTIGLQIKQLLQEIEVLFHKRLFKQCQKRLNKARQLAQIHEIYADQLSLLNWEIEILKARKYDGVKEEDLAQLHQEQAHSLASEEQLLRYKDLSNRFFRQGVEMGIIPRNDERWMRIYREVEDRFINNDEESLSKSAQAIKHVVVGRYYHSMGEIEKSDNQYLEHLQLMETYHPKQLAENMGDYLTAFHNYLITQAHLKNWGFLKEELVRFREIKVKTRELEVRQFVMSYILESEVHIMSGLFAEGLPVVEAIEAGLDRYGKLIHAERKHLLYYNMAVICFGAEAYSKSLRWLNQLVIDERKNLRPDIYVFARIISLIVHFEMGNQDQIEYYVKSAYRFLSSKNYMFKLEELILDFIKHTMPRVNTPRETKTAFEVLYKDLMTLYEDPQEAKVQMYFDFDAWLKSKISKESFSELVRERAQV